MKSFLMANQCMTLKPCYVSVPTVPFLRPCNYHLSFTQSRVLSFPVSRLNHPGNSSSSRVLLTARQNATTSVSFQCRCTKDENFTETKTFEGDSGLWKQFVSKLQIQFFKLMSLFLGLIKAAFSKLTPKWVVVGVDDEIKQFRRLSLFSCFEKRNHDSDNALNQNSPESILGLLHQVSAYAPELTKFESEIALFFLILFFGKKRREPERIRFDQLLGLDAPKNEMKQILKRLLTATAPTGILLYGPQRTGKTTLAHALAHEANVSFVPVIGKQIVGEKGILVLKGVFTEARITAPSIVCVTNVEAIALVEEFVGEIEKCKKDRASVLVIATTENLNKLNEDLFKWFSTLVPVAKPDLKIRQQMAEVLLKNIVLQEEKDAICKRIAFETYGRVWHDIELVCHECHAFATSTGGLGTFVTMEHVSQTLKVTKAKYHVIEGRQKAMSDKGKETMEDVSETLKLIEAMTKAKIEAEKEALKAIEAVNKAKTEETNKRKETLEYVSHTLKVIEAVNCAEKDVLNEPETDNGKEADKGESFVNVEALEFKDAN